MREKLVCGSLQVTCVDALSIQMEADLRTFEAAPPKSFNLNVQPLDDTLLGQALPKA